MSKTIYSLNMWHIEQNNLLLEYVAYLNQVLLIWNGKSPRITQNVRNSPPKKLILDVLKKTMRPVSARWWETLREQWGK